jgi:hypothetical protein
MVLEAAWRHFGRMFGTASAAEEPRVCAHRDCDARARYWREVRVAPATACRVCLS